MYICTSNSNNVDHIKKIDNNNYPIDTICYFLIENYLLIGQWAQYICLCIKLSINCIIVRYFVCNCNITMQAVWLICYVAWLYASCLCMGPSLVNFLQKIIKPFVTNCKITFSKWFKRNDISRVITRRLAKYNHNILILR